MNWLQGTPSTVKPRPESSSCSFSRPSYCGLTPQYEGLEKLHEELSGRGFTVLGVPCNQFMGQEPGTSEEIAEFCSTTYGVTFPMTSKVDVNGSERHPLY